METRKPGRRKTDLSDESDSELIAKAKPLIRTDHGGKDALNIIRKKMVSMGTPVGVDACKNITLGRNWMPFDYLGYPRKAAQHRLHHV